MKSIAGDDAKISDAEKVEKFNYMYEVLNKPIITTVQNN